jgi:hypothetical protein
MELFNVDQFDSKEELWFSYYLSELKQHGYIDNYKHHPKTFVLSDAVYVNVFVKMKTFNKPKKVKLLNESKYTPDFEINWNKKAKDVFYWTDGGVYDKGTYPYSKPNKDNFIPFNAQYDNLGNPFTLVDVKGAVAGRNNNSAISFPINQKFLMKTTQLFVQKVVVSLCEKGLFYRSFFPRTVVADEKYKRNCTHGKEGDSKIKVDVRLIEKWLKIKDGNKG